MLSTVSESDSENCLPVALLGNHLVCECWVSSHWVLLHTLGCLSWEDSVILFRAGNGKKKKRKRHPGNKYKVQNQPGDLTSGSVPASKNLHDLIFIYFTHPCRPRLCLHKRKIDEMEST